MKGLMCVTAHSPKIRKLIISYVLVAMLSGIFLSGLFVIKSSAAGNTNPSSTNRNSVQKNKDTIATGTEYAYMSDEWNVYIATAISDSVIKIENWNKTMNVKKKLKYNYDIGAYKITDSATGFEWLDEEHTAFSIIFQDKNNWDMRKSAAHVFTVNINSDAYCRGTDYSKDIVCYEYVCDDWHMYRAIPLTDNMIKIECWARGTSISSYLFGWDWCVIDLTATETDFEWLDEEHSGFTITTQDPQNDYYWKKPKFVAFMLENKKYKYNSVIDYLNNVPAK